MADRSSDEQFTTRPLRIFLWGFGAGLAAMALSVSVNWGDIGPWAQRLRNGVEAVSDPPTTTTVVAP
jgi:hypothetical protein